MKGWITGKSRRELDRQEAADARAQLNGATPAGDERSDALQDQLDGLGSLFGCEDSPGPDGDLDEAFAKTVRTRHLAPR